MLTVFLNLFFEKVGLVNLAALAANRRIPTLTACSGTSCITLGLSADWYIILSVNLAVEVKPPLVRKKR